MKHIGLIIFIGMCATAVNAQNMSDNASQTVNLKLSNAIELTFTGTGNNQGGDVTLNFLTVNEYANGIESTPQWLKVRSNKDYSISIKSNATNFTYTGNTTPAPVMKVQDVLGVLVSNNLTGGNIEHPFSSTSYKRIREVNEHLLQNCTRGGNQTFAVKYKATPGFAYPAGTYSVDVVYTATQQ